MNHIGEGNEARPEADEQCAVTALSEQMTSANALIRLSRLIQDVFTSVSARHDLTPVQARLLGVLVAGPKGMAELARMFGVERAAMTGLVDRAERSGLVERVPVPGDRRAVHVTVTDLGRRTGGAVHADSTRELDRLLDPLSIAERADLRIAMAKILTPTNPSTDSPRTS